MILHQLLERAKRKFNSQSIVLMYHRIADPAVDSWELSVSAANFEEQLQVLKKSGLVIPMSDLIERIYLKKDSRPAIVLTFDDGYVDNYLCAKPLLEKYEMPATFFVSTKHIGIVKEFWWDELENILLLSPILPPNLFIHLNDLSYQYDLAEEIILTDAMRLKHNMWNYNQVPPTDRTRIYLEIWKLLSPLTYSQQQEVIETLKVSLGRPYLTRNEYCLMSEKQLKELASVDSFTIGGHTVTHPSLTNHSKEMQAQEISANKEELQLLTGSIVNTFAYPSGNLNDDTVGLLKQQGFQAAFTTHHQSINKNQDPYLIGRFQVNNWNGKRFEQAIKKWL